MNNITALTWLVYIGRKIDQYRTLAGSVTITKSVTVTDNGYGNGNGNGNGNGSSDGSIN